MMRAGVYRLILFSVIIFISSCRNRNTVQFTEPDDTLLFHCVMDSCSEIPFEKGNTGMRLPDTLVINPGIYNINGIAFNASRQGLVRALFISGSNYQRIIFDNDTLALLLALS